MNNKLPASGRWSLLTLSILVPLLATSSADARELECGRCHEDVVVDSPVHQDQTCVACHSNVTERRHRDALTHLGSDAICVQCHRLADKNVTRSVHHGAASCSDCHGPGHGIHSTTDKNSEVAPVNQIAVCGSCHDDPPELVEGFVGSVHGRGLLRSGLASAPSCSACHGNHRMFAISDGRAPTSNEHAPEMCGRCHVGVLDTWSVESAHGVAWKAGNSEVPVCTTCHSSHNIQDPVTTKRLDFPDQCGDCHGDQYTSYRGSFHGKSTNLGFWTAATCSDCHTTHKVLPADDPRSSIHPENLGETCGNCHENITASFLQFDPHNDPSDPNDNAYVYYVHTFMLWLLLGVFLFFGVHDLLWLQRSWVGAIRGEVRGFKRPLTGPYIRRFSGVFIAMHIVIIITFLSLALTGLPLKFDTAPWAQTLMNLLGGVDSARVIHRIAAVGTFGYLAGHLIHLFIRAIVKQEGGLFWGPHSMVPQWQDLKDMAANVRYFLYLGPPAEGDRWAYWEKFDYFAVFWGVMIIGLSGLMLWLPTFFASFLPGWTINAAQVVHSEEALLATGFIFVFHFFHTDLRPESFPLDPVVFTGRMPLERFKEERPREYQRMVANGTLEDAICPAPTKEEMGWVYVFGFTALSIGLTLAVAIFWALLSR